MNWYNILFVSIVRFLKSVEGGFPWQNEEERSFVSALIISIFQSLNVFSIVPSIAGNKMIIVWILITLGNITYFMVNSRFRRIIGSSGKNAFGTIPRLIIIAYIIGSVVLFGATR